MVNMSVTVPYALLCILILAISSIGCEGESSPEPSSSSIGRGGGSSLGLSEETKMDAIDFIKGELLVRDAAIAQDGRKLSLVIIMNAAATEEYAKEVGENFVRYLKSTSPDESPGKEVGSGIYDYLIGVYTPTEKAIAEGAKARGARRISW